MQLINFRHTSIRWFVIGLALLFVVAHPAAAIKVSGAIIVEDLTLGQTFTHELGLSIDSGEPATDLFIDIMGIGQSIDQRYSIVEPSADTSPYTARPYITLDKRTVHLAPGDSEKVTATIKIPSNAGAGGRYAMIYVHSSPQGSGMTGIVTAINVPVFITLKDTKLQQTGQITGVDIESQQPGKPLSIATTLINTGNYAYPETKNEIVVTDRNGQTITSILTNATKYRILPKFSVQYTVLIDIPLSPGTYAVKSRILLKDGITLDERNATFEVIKQYIPPFQPVSITLSPGSAAVLVSTGEKVSISFPAGAVLESAKLNLKPVLPDEVPRAQPGVTPAITAFSVDGLAGLLSKDATITVKYSPEDLEAVKGDASKLKLARWDKVENKWVVLPTTLDRNAGTLTVTTNRLSVWAVVVSEGAIPGETKTEGFTALIACGALAMIFIASRLRRR